jgi:hypothetical protein
MGEKGGGEETLQLRMGAPTLWTRMDASWKYRKVSHDHLDRSLACRRTLEALYSESLLTSPDPDSLRQERLDDGVGSYGKRQLISLLRLILRSLS